MYILFDTETTGKETTDKIVQVGAMLIDNKKNVQVIDEMCSTEVSMTLGAMEIHGITPEMLEGKPKYAETTFKKLLDELNTEKNFLVAHNISFDLGMIQKEGFKNNMQLIDTCRAAMHLIDGVESYRLQHLRYALGLYKTEEVEAEALGVEIKAHDAIGDVMIMKLLLSRLVEEVRKKYPKENPIAKLVELTKTPAIIKVFKFGKYKGENIADIYQKDKGYISWMRKNMDMDENLEYTLDQHLKGE